MVEKLKIFNKLGEATGELKERVQVLTDGDWHQSSHIWIEKNGKFLMQKRSEFKKAFPNMWIAPVSGHISENQTPLEAAIREAEEEVGIKIDIDLLDLIAIIRGTFTDEKSGFTEAEFINIYIYSGEMGEFKINKEEVSEMKWFDISEIRKMVDQKSKELVPAWEEYEAVLNYFKYNPGS